MARLVSELEAQVARLGLGGRVHFLGSVPPDELKWPLSAADVFVLATRNEGWANVFLEAMACGLPVLATSVGGAPDVIRHEASGWLIPPEDMDALQRGLETLLADASLRLRLGVQARQRILADFSMDSVARRLAALYQKLIRD